MKIWESKTPLSWYFANDKKPPRIHELISTADNIIMHLQNKIREFVAINPKSSNENSENRD